MPLTRTRCRIKVLKLRQWPSGGLQTQSKVLATRAYKLTLPSIPYLQSRLTSKSHTSKCAFARVKRSFLLIG